MRFTRSITLLDFDVRGFRNHFDSVMTETIKEAARSWLRTVLVLIPTWSRASRATFEALANSVGFNVTYGPQLSSKDRLLLGFSTGNGGLKIEKNKSWHFFYETDLRYLAHNEFNRAVKGDGSGVFSELTNPGPYRFQEAGANDFLSFSREVILPNPYDFVKPKRLT